MGIPIGYHLGETDMPFHYRFVIVHQADLSDSEKMLRQFDLASKYGPCTDMTRLERWERAFTLVSGLSGRKKWT